jgi:hypothetical protein
MSPEQVIAALDRALGESGEDVVLRRTTGSQLVPLEVTVRACVRSYETQARTEGVTIDAMTVILSPTEMRARQWCWPPRVGDFAVVQGRERRVEVCDPVYIAGELVRMNLAVAG